MRIFFVVDSRRKPETRRVLSIIEKITNRRFIPALTAAAPMKNDRMAKYLPVVVNFKRVLKIRFRNFSLSFDVLFSFKIG